MDYEHKIRYKPDWCTEPDDWIEFTHKGVVRLSILGVDSIAEEVAEDYFYQRDGWEGQWPRRFYIEIDGVDQGLWEVEMETVPAFHASKHNESKHERDPEAATRSPEAGVGEQPCHGKAGVGQETD